MISYIDFSPLKNTSIQLRGNREFDLENVSWRKNSSTTVVPKEFDKENV